MSVVCERKWSTFIKFLLVSFLISFVLLALLAFGLKPIRQPLWELYLSAPMYEAIEARNAAEVSNLLKRGANPNRIGAGGLVGGTPLTWAIGNSDIQSIKVLIAGGANVNQRFDEGYTPLMLVTNPQVALLLLKAGANPKTKNDNGQTALQYVEANKLSKVAEVLQRIETKK